MQLPGGTSLQNGKYIIDRCIGQGGFGITYKASWHTSVQGPLGQIETRIPVAIKEFFFQDYCDRDSTSESIRISSSSGKEFFEKFKNKLKKEAAILSAFSHPHIVKVLEVFEENNTAYMVMQFIEGESLHSKIKKEGKLPEAQAMKYIGQVSSALQEVHRRNILHLDIKPGNILIDKNDNALLIDFGISKRYNDRHQETSTTPVGISKGYAPPEQYAGVGSFTPATDIYSLCATFYFMVTAEVPTESLLRNDEELISPKALNPDLSDAVNDRIMKGMHIPRKDRYQSVEEFMPEKSTLIAFSSRKACEQEVAHGEEEKTKYMEDEPVQIDARGIFPGKFGRNRVFFFLSILKWEVILAFIVFLYDNFDVTFGPVLGIALGLFIIDIPLKYRQSFTISKPLNFGKVLKINWYWIVIAVLFLIFTMYITAFCFMLIVWLVIMDLAIVKHGIPRKMNITDKNKTTETRLKYISVILAIVIPIYFLIFKTNL